MAVKSYDFQMDLKEKISTIPITLVQGDTNSNIFNISITEDSVPIDLTGSTVTITMKKPDNTIIVGNCTIIDAINGLIRYTCGTNDIAAVGTVIFSLEIFINSARVSTTQGKFKVITELDNGSGIPSTTEYPILTNLISTVNTGEAARTTSENTRNTNETTRQSNESARIASEITKNANEDARIIAENARSTNENDRISAETTRGIDEIIRISAEDTRQNNEANRISSESARTSNEIIRQSNETTRINNENARLVWAVYDPSTPYIPGNKVTKYGCSYVNIVACQGISPTSLTDNANWVMIAAKGDTGSTGPAGPGTGDMLRSVYDTNNDGIVDRALLADSASSVQWTNVQSRPTNVSQFTNDSSYETTTGAQAKATAAQTTAQSYTDTKASDLAGTGRTTETIKGNADTLTSHIAKVTHVGGRIYAYKNIGGAL